MRLLLNNRRLAACLLALALAGAVTAPAAGRLVYTKRWWTPYSQLWVAQDDGSGARRLVSSRLPWVLLGPAAISPDGESVVYALTRLAGQGGERLMVIPAAGGQPRLLARETAFAAWSPDARTIAATRFVPGPVRRQQLLAIDAATGSQRVLAEAPRIEHVSFSPAGDALAYAAGSGRSSDVYTVPLLGGPARRLTRNGHSVAPAWGRRFIALSRWYPTRRAGHPAQKADLYLIPPTGGPLHRMTHLHATFLWPTAWPTGGHRLLLEIATGTPPSLTHPSATDWAATITIPRAQVRQIGRPSRGNGPFGVAGAAISRDGRAVLATKYSGDRVGGIDVVTLPFLGGRPHVLARHAMDPSWSR